MSPRLWSSFPAKNPERWETLVRSTMLEGEFAGVVVVPRYHAKSFEDAVRQGNYADLQSLEDSNGSIVGFGPGLQHEKFELEKPVVVSLVRFNRPAFFDEIVTWGLLHREVPMEPKHIMGIGIGSKGDPVYPFPTPLVCFDPDAPNFDPERLAKHKGVIVLEGGENGRYLEFYNRWETPFYGFV